MTDSISPHSHLARIAVRPVPDTLSINDHWQETAARKGYRITRRVNDRYQLMLRCNRCGLEHRSKRNVLMDHQPLCPHCTEAQWRDDATAAGLVWIGRDPEDRHNGYYLAPCRHVQRCQFVNVKKITQEKGALRCDDCQRSIEEQEARAQGWTRIGPAPARGPNYRLYRHGCGHEQAIARVNMQTGRFGCAGCGVAWSSAPSFLYAMRFRVPGQPPMIKLGFSRNPESRLRHQLMRTPTVHGELLRQVPVANGHEALRLEKRMHTRLKLEHPDAVVPSALYRADLRVKSEIYAATLEPRILQMLDALSADTSALN